METPRLEIDWVVVRPILCLVLGALLAGAALVWVASHWLSAPDWASVEGQVVQANVIPDTNPISRPSGRGTWLETRYKPDIVYQYRVGGRDYTGFGIGDGVDLSYPTYEGAAAAVARYNRGSVTVWYDPTDPERSALDTNVFGIVLFAAGGLGLLLLGLGFWLRRQGRVAEEAGDQGAI